jgi:hypothetical protein
MEAELRKIRDKIAEKRQENSRIQYVIKREEELRRHKATLEQKALLSLSGDLLG